jgi:hypothetical protein
VKQNVCLKGNKRKREQINWKLDDARRAEENKHIGYPNEM